ncbi:MAG TPA: hypothetical protein EYP59_22300, partial [Thiotrichaceae bacterium]|nr:hypothetical protein [Thiotrichaceae bacterium]
MQLSKIIVKIALLLVCCFFLVSISNAAMVNKQGAGQMVYTGWGGPSAAIKKEAFAKAKLSAFNRYIATFDVTKTSTYEKIQSEIESNLDRYIIDCKIIDDDIDKDSK